MSPTSLNFAVFVFAGFCLYYIFPKKHRWCVLLALSMFFYASAGIKLFYYLAFTSVSTYLGAIFTDNINIKLKTLDKDGQKNYKRCKKLICMITLILNFALLFVLKYLPDIYNGIFGHGTLTIALPLGISFYIFMTTGYVVDVYRAKIKAQRNFAKFLLFTSFFPQMIQGPIGRYDSLSDSLYGGNDFSFDNIKEGLTLIGLGLFKKLVVADRASVPVGEIIDGAGYSGGEVFSAVVLYCIQLYFDFSGGIDIMRGVAMLFGVRMAENFKRPIFAKSLTDFWRRWHVTLGAWMKDYVFYPITLSKAFTSFARVARRHLKGRAAKVLPVSAATFIVYFAIGVWHGGSGKYILFGFWNGMLITVSLLLEPCFVKVKNRLKINDGAWWYKSFCMLRTMLLVLFGRYITRAASVSSAFSLLKTTFCRFSISGVFSPIFLSFGLSIYDYAILFAGVFVVLIFEYFEEKGRKFSDRLSGHPLLDTALIILAVASIFAFGIYRGSHISPDFIYKQF